MSRIIFAPICERCGHEFTNFEYSLGSILICPECNANIDDISIINYSTLLQTNKERNWVISYSKDNYY